MKPFLMRYRQRQGGSTAVEFALVSAFGGLFVALLGAMELGRVLFYLNTANEATRLGARPHRSRCQRLPRCPLARCRSLLCPL